MTNLKWLTIATIWLAFLCYAVSISLIARRRWQRPLTCMWISGVILFWTHVALAFAAYYDWSMTNAYTATLRQTAEVTGWQSGSGLYVNFLFGGVWTWDALQMLRGIGPYRSRRRAVIFSVHGFLAFMFLNGTVVFGSGPIRWLGVATTILLGGLAVHSWRASLSPTVPSASSTDSS